MDNTGICSICEGQYIEYGNNAYPFAGRCCHDCDNRFVIPARIMQISADAQYELAILQQVARLGRTMVQAQAKMRSLQLVKDNTNAEDSAP